MKNFRKLFLGLYYLTGVFLLVGYEIHATQGKCDFIGLGTLAAGLATGVGTLVWGYNKEHDNETKIAIATAGK
jgi:hypothetical protein